MWTSALKTHRDGLVACAFLAGFLTCVRTVSAASANGDGVSATPTLVIMTSKEIRVFASNSTKRSSGVVVHEVVEGAALALNYARRTILWSDHTTELLKTAAFDGQQLTGAARNLTAVGQVTADGLAVDWYTGNVYWTDGELDTVEVAAEGGASRRVLYWTDIDQPRAIALVPMSGILFWSDWGEIPKIERAAMNGDPASRVVVVSDNIYWPNGITVDYARERVYWLDGKHRFIDAMDYDGGRRATLVGENIGHPFALAFFDDRVYWTDWETWSVHTVRVGDNDTRPTKLYHLDTGLMAIHVWDARYQPPGASPCGADNGGCSHLCLLAPAAPRRYECACPTGVLLGADARTCRDGPLDVLLFAQRTHISQISVDTPDHTAFVVPLRNVRHTIALDFDPVDGYLYWSDDELRAIRRARLDGSDERDVVADVAHSDGVAFDWIARNVYWTDTGLDRIEVARHDGSSRRVVVFEALGEPRAIAVAPVDGWLFWTDWSEDDPKIERASLDGSERIVVVTTDLGWPNGLALDLDASKVYWGDAKNDKIEVANMDGTDRRVVVDDNLPHLFGLTLLGDHLYWTDWLRRSIDRVDKITGKDRQVISEPLPNIMGIKAVHLGPPNGTNACAKDNGGCSHLCLNRPSGYRCACEINAELAADGRTCVRPDVFLLFARKDNVGRISVTSGHVELIPVAGSKSPRSLDYEFADERVYWIDGRTHAISRSYLNGSAVQKVLELGSGSAESMAIDWVAHNVYWTNADTQRIEVARLDGSSRKILVWRDLDAPHSIVLDPNAAYIFWSELGDADRITRAAMDGSRRKVIVANAGRARGLALDYERERIFWGDRTYNVIKSALYDGSDVRAVVSHDVADPFGLTLHADRVYWSDPVNKDVESANKVDGSARKKIASYSEPPDDFVVYHSSRQSGWNPCAVGNGGCSHFCFAVPGGGAGGVARSTCGCPTHYVPHATSGCVAPKSYILYSHKNAVSRLLPGNLDCPDTVLPIQFKNIRAIEYDPTQAYLYWIDGKHKTIRKTLSDGTSIPVVVVNGGHLCDIALDLLGRALFWSDSESNVINVTRLHDGAVAETVVGDADARPRQIAVHAVKRLLFWIDARASGPRIERARVDGTRRRPLWSGVATALAVDAESDAVFWYAKSVFRADLAGRGARELTATLTSHVVAMTAFGAYLYWIDGEKQQIEYADKSGASPRVEAALPQKIQQATDLLVVAPLAEDVRTSHRCSAAHAHGRCSHLCVWSADEPDEVCACVPPLTLQDDGENCLSQHVCEPNYFTCASPEPNGRECIPAAWRCDGQKDCPDNSDEQECPKCADDEFRCGSGQCIDQKWVCDGTTHCPDARDEARCCDGSSQFRCPSNDVCVGYDLLCDGWENCADGADESEAICSNPDFRKVDVTSSRSRNALYIIVLVGFGTLLLILLLAYVFRVRLAKSDPPPYDRATDPLSPAGRPPSKADAAAAAKKTRAAAARIRISTLGESLIAGYDRGHVTGASSSTNGSGCYPLETLNPPPSPATTAASTRASSSSSRYRPYKHYRTINRPPPPTPCSTDVCDESDSNYHPRGRYDAQLPPYELFPPPYEPFPPPPTPRSHCHTESCPPSPSSRSSTNFSPLPPPPSPVPPHPKGYDS